MSNRGRFRTPGGWLIGGGLLSMFVLSLTTRLQFQVQTKLSRSVIPVKQKSQLGKLIDNLKRDKNCSNDSCLSQCVAHDMISHSNITFQHKNTLNVIFSLVHVDNTASV